VQAEPAVGTTTADDEHEQQRYRVADEP